MTTKSDTLRWQCKDKCTKLSVKHKQMFSSTQTTNYATISLFFWDKNIKNKRKTWFTLTKPPPMPPVNSILRHIATLAMNQQTGFSVPHGLNI